MVLWIDDPSVLLDSDLNSWNPLQGSIENKINAITKIIVISAGLMALKNKNKKIFLKAVVAIGVVMIAYTLLSGKEGFWGGKPMSIQDIEENPELSETVEIKNPLGNSLPGNSNLSTFPGSDKQIDEVLGEHVPNNNIFYGNNSTVRPFYKIPEDRDNYKEFLYSEGFANKGVSKGVNKEGSIYAHLGQPYHRLS